MPTQIRFLSPVNPWCTAGPGTNMRQDESSEDFDSQLFNKLPPDYFSKPAPAVFDHASPDEPAALPSSQDLSTDDRGENHNPENVQLSSAATDDVAFANQPPYATDVHSDITGSLPESEALDISGPPGIAPGHEGSTSIFAPSSDSSGNSELLLSSIESGVGPGDESAGADDESFVINSRAGGSGGFNHLSMQEAGTGPSVLESLQNVGAKTGAGYSADGAGGGTAPGPAQPFAVPGVTVASAAGAGLSSHFAVQATGAEPSGAASDTPTLIWVGDLGNGSSSSGTGTSSTGNPGSTVTGSTVSSGMTIDVVYDSSVSSAPAGFVTAVNQVASWYESHFSNSVTVTIDVGFGEVAGQSLASGALGESETALTSVSYAQLQSALVQNANAIGDTAAAASLPASSPVGGQFWVPTAEAEALGINGAIAPVNGYVGFSSTANFQYNDSSGVASNQYDFFGVVAHEFSEVMGRTMMDGEVMNGTSSYEPLDLFHYSAPGVRDFSGTTAGYASANGGSTSLGSFNTNPGGDFGDWASSVGHDSFLAYTAAGAVDPISANDIALMNLLGWNSTPSPVVSAATASPATGAERAGVIIPITLAMSEAVTVSGGTPTLILNDGGTATYDAAHSTATSLVFDYTVAAGQNAASLAVTGVSLNGATVADAAGNAAAFAGADVTFSGLKIDTTAPTVTAATTAPTSGTEGAGVTIPITLAMSEAVTVSGGTPTLTLNDGGTATYDAAHSTATSLVFDYTVAAGQNTASLAVTGVSLNGATVADAAGNAAAFAGADVTFSGLADQHRDAERDGSDRFACHRRRAVQA